MDLAASTIPACAVISPASMRARMSGRLRIITGSDFLMDGGVTAAYRYGDLGRQH
jgi:hypothetical protein